MTIEITRRHRIARIIVPLMICEQAVARARVRETRYNVKGSMMGVGSNGSE